MGLTFLDSDTIVNFLLRFRCRLRHLLSCCRLSIGECWLLDFFRFSIEWVENSIVPLRLVSRHRCASFVSSYCPRCLRKSVSPNPVLCSNDSLKVAPVLYAFRCKINKLDLHLSFSEVVWETLLVLWLVRLASKLYSSGWHVLQFRSPVSSLGTLGQRPAGLKIYSTWRCLCWTEVWLRHIPGDFCADRWLASAILLLL